MARLAAMVVGLVAACTGAPSLVPCSDDDACARGDRLGRCEADQRCSFADPSCPTGRRYDADYAGEVAGVCVARELPTWLAVLGSAGDEGGDRVHVAYAPTSDRVLVLGVSAAPIEGYAEPGAFLITLDAATGAYRAHRTFGNSGYGVHGLAALPDGGARALVRTVGALTLDGVTVSSAGPSIWTFDRELVARAALPIDADGDLASQALRFDVGLVAGTIVDGGVALGARTITAPADRAVAWVARHDGATWGPARALDTTATPVAIDALLDMPGGAALAGALKGTLTVDGTATAIVAPTGGGGADGFTLTLDASLTASGGRAYAAGAGVFAIAGLTEDGADPVAYGQLRGAVGGFPTCATTGAALAGPAGAEALWSSCELAAVDAASIADDDAVVAGPVADGAEVRRLVRDGAGWRDTDTAWRLRGDVHVLTTALRRGPDGTTQAIVAGWFAGEVDFGGALRTAAGADWFVAAYRLP